MAEVGGLCYSRWGLLIGMLAVHRGAANTGQRSAMDAVLVGQLAALGTSVCFTFGSTFFTFAGRELGSPLVNRARLLMALSAILIVHTLLEGQPLPFDATGRQWFWLGLSGFIGFVLGDIFLFQAFVMIGPRLSMLMMALAPVIATVAAWVFLAQRLSAIELLGIALTVGGVMSVVVAGGIPNLPDKRYYRSGILFGLGGAIGQAGGLVTASVGLEDGFSALSGITIRLLVATVMIWAGAGLMGLVPSSIQRLRANPRGVRFMVVAVLAGPLLGVYLSLVAVQNAPVGIAAALTSLPPIFLIPVGIVLFNEKVNAQAIVGTLIAIGGTLLLFA